MDNEAHVVRFTLLACFLGTVSTLGGYGMFVWDLSWGSLLGGGLIGLIVFIWRINSHDARYFFIVEEGIPQERGEAVYKAALPITGSTPPEPGRHWVMIQNDKAQQYIYQPMPAVFPRFIRESIDINNKIQFSQRQAVRRGYTVEQYEIVVSQLKSLDWLTDKMANNAPVFNKFRIDEVLTWLSKPLVS